MRSPRFWPEAGKHVSASLDALLFGLSVYGVPIAIAVVSFLAFFSWDNQYPTDDANPVDFRVIQQTGSGWTPAQALTQLAGKKPVPFFDTNRSEAPFWFSFSPEKLQDGAPAAIELPSRHAVSTICWDAASLSSLGEANRERVNGSFERAQAGSAFSLAPHESTTAVLCRGTFAGPARLTVVEWPAPELEAAIQKFHRSSGLLDGGLILLSIFVLITAFINREWTYVVFAVWLVASLRLAALSAGWDTQWMEHTVPDTWLLPMRQVTCTAFYILMVTLFSRMFRDELLRVGYAKLLRATQWSCLPLLAATLILPYTAWLPWLWVFSSFALVAVVFLLLRILFITRSTVAMWYAGSLGITLFASFYEIVAAALSLKGMIGSINFVTASLSSGLLAALAIAEQMRQERLARMRAQAELRNTYDAIPIGLFTLDANGIFLRGNPALEQMLGVDLTRNARDHWSDHFEPGAWAKLRDGVSANAREMEIREIAKGSTEPKLFLVKATFANDKIEGSLQDITESSKATSRLHFLADHDPLTSVLNRRGIEKAFELAMTGLTSGQALSLAYLDLDRFKLINDLFGHLAGDEVLKQVCARVKEALGEGHQLGRIGGDEFVVLFRATDIEAATGICHEIVDRIVTLPYRTGDKAFQVKGSIGLVEVGSDIRVKDAISAADRACREAKKGLHGNLVIYKKTDNVFRERQEELRLVEHLGAGVAPDGLFLVMQPIMSMSAPYASLNFEILLRMREPDGRVSPAWKIISAAENNGRSGVIDRWVMSHTLEWLDANNDALDRTRFVCMNLSGASLNDERFIEDAFSMLSQHSRAAQKLCVEITESVALHDLENTRRFIDRVRGFGAKIALDDFGAGYTSFSYLKELRADTLKIDGNFVQGVNAHPANRAIVEAIVELARNLGMKSVAEWAENLPILEVLAEIGVDYVQGYAIARPQLPADILVAQSSASFILDEQTAEYVKNIIATGKVIELWDGISGKNLTGVS